MNELLLLKKYIMWVRFSYIINFFNSNNSLIKKCQVFLMDYRLNVLIIFNQNLPAIIDENEYDIGKIQLLNWVSMK